MSEAYDLLCGPRVGARSGAAIVVGTSMGALVGLNWALRHRELVHSVILGCPVLDLMALYKQDRFGTSTSIAAAYGVKPPALPPGLATHSPVEYATQLAGIPILVYASSDDPIADDTAACGQFRDRVGGDQIEVHDLGRAGHWPIDTPVGEALEFAKRSCR
jgi:acetyl esterase/lipase